MRACRGFLLLVLGSVVAAPGCVVNEGVQVDIGDREVLLTILHTADIHSRLLPYDMQVGAVDRRLGLRQENSPFGGAARLAYLVKRERGRASRVLHIDSGDPFQGAPIFNFFRGQAEFRVLSEIGLDVLVIGNHEFDLGGPNLAEQLEEWARFAPLAANYVFEPAAYSENDLARLVRPYAIFNLRGLRVGVIGLGDTTSMYSIFETGNRLGITPLSAAEVTQRWVDFLRPQVDLIVVATHQGLRGDERIIRDTEGIDVVMGGHLHIVLDPPKVLYDCQSAELRAERGCTPRPVVLCHSGAFLKYLGRLDLALQKNPADPRNGFEVVSHQYRLFPIDSSVPEDATVAHLLEPYVIRMQQVIDLDRLVGYAPRMVRRFGRTGGDSALGNLVADSMWLRAGIETDFALTNTTGIRADLNPGPVTIEELFNIFPFDNTITTMFLSGLEVRELFDYVARRSASRGCNSQVQIAGARIVINCRGCERTGGLPCAESIRIGSGENPPEISEHGSYELATNNYLAQGGSGYVMLRRNTTQRDSGIPQRDAVIDRIRSGRPCVERECDEDGDCDQNQLCACSGRWVWDGDTCLDEGTCVGLGRCVLESCLEEVAHLYLDRVLSPGDDPEPMLCSLRNYAGSECAEVPCVDEGIGAVEDGRILAYLP